MEKLSGPKIVHAAYRIILGRTPESSDVVQSRAQQEILYLIVELLSSKEFEGRFVTEVLNGQLRQAESLPTIEDLALVLPALDVPAELRLVLTEEFSLATLLKVVLQNPAILTNSQPLRSMAFEMRLSERRKNSQLSVEDSVLLSPENKSAVTKLFDLSYYAEQVGLTFASISEAITHYIENPLDERGNPSPYFSRDLYARMVPAIVPMGIDPLSHYIGLGRFQALNPHPLFDIQYVSQWIDCKS